MKTVSVKGLMTVFPMSLHYRPIKGRKLSWPMHCS